MARTGLSRHFMLKENISWEGSFTASQKTLVDKPNTHSHCIQVYKKVAKIRSLDDTAFTIFSIYKHEKLAMPIGGQKKPVFGFFNF